MLMKEKIINIYKNNSSLDYIDIAREVDCSFNYVKNIVREYRKYEKV